MTLDNDAILHARNAELAVLGCTWLGADAAGDVFAQIPIGNIESFDVQEGLALMREILDDGKPCNSVTFVEEFRKKHGRAFDFGVIDQAANIAFSIHNLEYWAGEISDAATRRRLQTAAITLQARALDADKTPQEALGELEATLDSQNAILSNVEPSSKVCRRFLDKLEARKKRQGQLSGVPSGFWKLDQKLDGFQFGEMTLIGARPSIGKTAFAASVVDAACLQAGVPTLFVTLEMSSEALMRRMFSTSGGVDAGLLRRGTYEKRDEERMGAFLPKVSKAPLYFLDLPGGTPHPVITAAARRHVRKHGVKLVIVDYMQLIGAPGKHEKRTYEVGSASTAMKAFAKSSGVALVVMAQLNRESEKGEKRAPRLADLGDSKQLEQDADCVILLHRDRGEPVGPATLIVSKQRDGETGAVDCRYNGKYVRFEDDGPKIAPED